MTYFNKTSEGSVDSLGFNKNLNPTDNTYQKCFQTIDQLVMGSEPPTGGTQGSVIIHNGVSWDWLQPGSPGRYLSTQGAGADVIWSSIVAPSGGGDVYGPVTTTENYLPQWDAGTKQLKDGLGVTTSVSAFGSDSLIPTEKAVRDALNAAVIAPINTISITGGNYNVSLAESGSTFTVSPSASGFMLPSVSSSNIGVYYKFAKLGAGSLSVSANDSDIVIDSGAGKYVYNSTANETYAVLGLQLMSETQWLPITMIGSWTTIQ